VPQPTAPPRALFDPRTVQPVASRYTDYAIPAHSFHRCSIKMEKQKKHHLHHRVAQ
jgi:hypothetical protein